MGDQVTMSNSELAAAIHYAFQSCDRVLVGGYINDSGTKGAKVMLEHLEKLLAIQVERAS